MENFVKAMTAILVFALVSLVCAYPTLWIVNYLFTPQVLCAVFGVSQSDFLESLLAELVVYIFI